MHTKPSKGVEIYLVKMFWVPCLQKNKKGGHLSAFLWIEIQITFFSR
jgi:hypothetical protein